MDHLKIFIEFGRILLPFYVLVFFFFGWEACRILASGPGIKPAPLHWKHEVLTTGLPGRSLKTFKDENNLIPSSDHHLCFSIFLFSFFFYTYLYINIFIIIGIILNIKS